MAQLIGQGYTRAAVTDEASMLANLKAQLEAFNGLQLEHDAHLVVPADVAVSGLFDPSSLGWIPGGVCASQNHLHHVCLCF